MSTGYFWKSKNRRKKAGILKGSTSGKTKGENCKADWMKKYYITGARSYKEEGAYSTYCQLSRKLCKII